MFIIKYTTVYKLEPNADLKIHERLIMYVKRHPIALLKITNQYVEWPIVKYICTYVCI